MKHKITKQIEKQIRALAAKVPVTYHQAKEYKSGAALLKDNAEAKDVEGNALDGKKMYGCTVLIADNHFRRMKKAYQEGGVDGVNDYCAKVQVKLDQMQTVADKK